MDEFSFPAADLYRPVYEHGPPSNPSKSILSLPTEIIVDIARLNFKTAVALMCTNRVLHAAGVTTLYARAFLIGRTFTIRNPDAPNLLVPGVLGGLLAKREHTAALRYLKILSMPYDTDYWPAFKTLVYRVFERAHGLSCVDLKAMSEFQHPGDNYPQPIYPQNLHTLHLQSLTDYFAPHLLTAPSLKELSFCNPGIFLEHHQGPYSQVKSLRYTHQGVGSHTMPGDFLTMFGLFPSVERLEVVIDMLPQFLDCVPHIGNSWVKVKQLCLTLVWDVGRPPVDERTKGLLVQAFNRLCPSLDTAEVRCTRGYTVWPVMLWAGGRAG